MAVASSDQVKSTITTSKVASPRGRDLRLDLFRGLANWAIFLDHIPNNSIAWLTTRNYGFSDAADIFVFISGYTAAFVYARRISAQGMLAGTALLMRRVWQLYVAHVLLFVLYAAAIGYVAQRYGHSHLLDEFNVAGLIEQPVATLTQGLMLKFKPLNLDVLPLYIVLMAGFPPLLIAMMRWPHAALAASTAVYLAARLFGWNFSAYPSGGWYFNPFAWQLLFTLGAWAALGGRAWIQVLVRSRAVLAASVAFVVFAAVVTLANRLGTTGLLPAGVLEWFVPNDKTNLAPYRLLHLLALAVIVVRLVPADWSGLRSAVLRPLIVCGQRSLEVFCVGILLSFVGHFILEMDSDGLAAQVAVSAAGLMLMSCVAFYRTWSRSLDRPPSSAKPAAAPGDHCEHPQQPKKVDAK
ncbi:MULTISPECIES: OpgC domain-containing protein [unclassified Bradyrhizobium]|uniref:OpgC domain-containing protein n=1 Tax=unclassified Bradyrhizobium TaxID=2631580 RepID=UPI001BA97837|nr:MULTISPECIES: OpgC domain-containing protein [unclassified Bradyrhizobium]MBR1208094.1 OpgC domain-containing protein [Bradyrhizobium sp. AUGA SZCCT0124]MBR1316497.1 OpgC domain-containing protein [Bradyrhizobium sp. AUGA SZCCT0051]MBR1344608.1 OpgC domain-containing protein [Bradyrhizobium sp. AUGA SZCCT0105]MBR1359518.1 OpgC domain-containing protein [Bradyrhizobium sp. AUGA SZCCT0045]